MMRASADPGTLRSTCNLTCHPTLTHHKSVCPPDFLADLIAIDYSSPETEADTRKRVKVRCLAAPVSRTLDPCTAHIEDQNPCR
jgi:hypothetical protein